MQSGCIVPLRVVAQLSLTATQNGRRGQTATLMEAFLQEHQEKCAEVEEYTDELDISFDSDRKRL